ncbi:MULTISPECIES: hypothetical protein [Rhodococcus]|uniref:hypothetical protein n=1 Tax=Rhodococcus TaxID=1827 RepID=UPI000EB6C122|nr:MULTISPECIES: hypothetical protein [Rhodococcus]AXY49803.1 hypothetical protein YT1_0346 [Rhodococcus ruber]WML63001.1 hypothetical protein QNA09_24760 [Rhodococcus sp. AH-ZY2]
MKARATFPRLRAAAAVVVLYVLGFTLVPCGIAVAESHHLDLSHVVAVTGQSGDESAAGHAHIDNGASPLGHHQDQLFVVPRPDSPLRPIAVVTGIAVMMLVLVALRQAPVGLRAPPAAPSPPHRGRAILRELCIDRC